MVKRLKIERDSFQEQNMELKTTVEVQKKLIDKIEKVKTGSRDNSKGLF